MEKNSALLQFLTQAKEDLDVLAVILFGSQARGEAAASSDMDLCLVLNRQNWDPVALSNKKLDYLELDKIDPSIYQQLPLYIQRRVLREGQVLFVRNDEALYEAAFRTAQAFETFRYYHEEYLRSVSNDRP